VRIFYAADDSGNTAIKNSKTWYYNLYLPLVDLGNEVIRFNYNSTLYIQNSDSSIPRKKALIDKNRPKLEKELLAQIRKVNLKKPIDIFFSCFDNSCCKPEVIKEISGMGITTMNWYCNASYQFHLVKEIAPAYDYCLVPEKFRINDYRKIGANPIYFQEAANPSIYKPYNLPIEFDVTFIGAAYGERPEYIQYLFNQGINIKVWGPGWKNFSVNPILKTKRIAKKLMTAEGWQKVKERLTGMLSEKRLSQEKDKKIILPDKILGSPLIDFEMIQMYSRSKINLGFSSCGETHKMDKRILQIRLRDFEVPMSGRFYMVEYMPELEEFFKIGKEIVCYHNKEDLVNKIKYYLKNDVEREKIRQAGYKRSISDHTWQKRFRELFNYLKLAKNRI